MCAKFNDVRHTHVIIEILMSGIAALHQRHAFCKRYLAEKDRIGRIQNLVQPLVAVINHLCNFKL